MENNRYQLNKELAQMLKGGVITDDGLNCHPQIEQKLFSHMQNFKLSRREVS